jgi:hypothetical protein
MEVPVLVLVWVPVQVQVLVLARVLAPALEGYSIQRLRRLLRASAHLVARYLHFWMSMFCG